MGAVSRAARTGSSLGGPLGSAAPVPLPYQSFQGQEPFLTCDAAPAPTPALAPFPGLGGHHSGLGLCLAPGVMAFLLLQLTRQSSGYCGQTHSLAGCEVSVG